MTHERIGGLAFFAILVAAAFVPEGSPLYTVVGIGAALVVIAILWSLLHPGRR